EIINAFEQALLEALGGLRPASEHGHVDNPCCLIPAYGSMADDDGFVDYTPWTKSHKSVNHPGTHERIRLRHACRTNLDNIRASIARAAHCERALPRGACLSCRRRPHFRESDGARHPPAHHHHIDEACGRSRDPALHARHPNGKAAAVSVR